jgi:ABC-2 type transport system permease protein
MTTHQASSARAPHSKRNALYWTLSDTWVLIVRSLKHIFTNMDQLLGLTIQPIMFMLLFRYVFGGAIETGDITYVNFLTAGILIQLVAFGSLTTSMSVAADLQRGIIDRFKSLPMSNSAVIAGHVVADLVRNMISAIVLLLVAFVVGFRPSADVGDWFLITIVVLVFSFAMSWVAAIMGLLARSIEAVQWMGFLVVFPLTFASAAFVPTDTMPYYLRLFAENQPVTHVIEAVRALMVGTPVGDSLMLSIVWSIAIALVAIPIAGYLFRTHTGK